MKFAAARFLLSSHSWRPLRIQLRPLLLALSLSLLAAACATPRAATVGKPLPIDFTTLEGGSTIGEEMKGQVVLVEVWASWCRPCSQSLPFLEELGRELGPQGLFVVGINTDADPAAAERFLARHDVNVPYVRDPGARQVVQSFPLRKLPTLLLVDRDGAVRYTHEGFLSGDRPHIRRMVEGLLAGEN